MTYNGWTNKETWLVNMYVGDSIEEYMSPEAYESFVWDIVDTQIERHGFVRDLFNCAWYEINWRELSEHTKEFTQ